MKDLFTSLHAGWRDFLFPPLCWGCGHPLETACRDEEAWESFFCPHCLASVVLLEEPLCPLCCQPGVRDVRFCRRCSGGGLAFRRATAGALYRGAVRKLILRMKFGGQVGAAYPLAHLAHQGIRRTLHGQPWDGIAAVPLHPSRHRMRGYNQAEWMARYLSEITDSPFLNGVVRRVRDTHPQGKGGGGSRHGNVRGAFSPLEESLGSWLRGDLPGCSVQGMRILLVDDVMSTGATLDACATALMEAGADVVFAATAAT